MKSDRQSRPETIRSEYLSSRSLIYHRHLRLVVPLFVLLVIVNYSIILRKSMITTYIVQWNESSDNQSQHRPPDNESLQGTNLKTPTRNYNRKNKEVSPLGLNVSTQTSYHSNRSASNEENTHIYDFSNLWNSCSIARRLPEPYASRLRKKRGRIGNGRQCGGFTTYCRFSGSFWVSHKYKIQYMPVPKVESSLWRTFIGALEEEKELRNTQKNRLRYMESRNRGYFTFTFVDPRLVRRFFNGQAQIKFGVTWLNCNYIIHLTLCMLTAKSKERLRWGEVAKV
mmetsp:Transcript_18676/g.27928  ORF Transcript_18676/g.27928 Transcript_18676/m.27928 type:complete len:283 (+) Transcript_18676:335-1183(+)